MKTIEEKIDTKERDIATEEAKLEHLRAEVSDWSKSEGRFIALSSAIKSSVTFIKKLNRDLVKLKEQL